MADKEDAKQPDSSSALAEFEGHKPLKGHEGLGRAIVDKNGFPSGSPANYEALRSESVAELERLAHIEEGPTQEEIDATVQGMLGELGQ